MSQYALLAFSAWSSRALILWRVHLNSQQSLYINGNVPCPVLMVSIKRRASVACKIEDSFEYVADWKNYKSFIPMFLDIEPMSLVHYGPGTSLVVLLALGRMEVKTTLEVSEFQKNKKITIKATKGIRLRATWEFKDIGDKVLITLDFDYDLPAGLSSREDQKELLEKELDDSAVRSMELLKWVLESNVGETDGY